jgi:hypothetical protein
MLGGRFHNALTTTGALMRGLRASVWSADAPDRVLDASVCRTTRATSSWIIPIRGILLMKEAA